MPKQAAIAGVYEYPRRLVPDRTALQLKAECAAGAMLDAGLHWSEIDGLYDAGEVRGTGVPILGLAEYLGVHPSVVDETNTGGSSYEVLVGHAARDIQAGRCHVALVTYASRQRSVRFAGHPSPTIPVNNMEDIWGNTLIGSYALATARHMHEYGTTEEQLARIAVVTRRHALRNPDAVQALADLKVKNRGELTVEDVVNSRMIADPLRQLDCCLVSDGAGAVVVVSSEVARNIRNRPVWILGSGEAVGYVTNDGDLTTSAAAASGPMAFGSAGVSPEEVDVAMTYDSFTYTVLTALEDMGFCKKGEGGDFVSDDRLDFDAPLKPALNTDGGGLSSNHPGMRGIFLLIEATRQLRGQSASQVPEARLAVAHGNGGFLGGRHGAGTVILGT